jgi:hypothetical protein
MDGVSTGYSTPHNFTGLTGTHTFTVPGTDVYGYPFKNWTTGETSPTITVSADGTYTAQYYTLPAVTIWAWDNASGWLNEPITMDGNPTGFNTPYSFIGLSGTHTFTVPSSDTHGNPFVNWTTGETNPTIAVSSNGTYTAQYYMGEMRQLTISLVGSGTTDPAPGTYTFINGTEVPVNATPSPGWIFDHWVLDGTMIVTMNPIPMTMGRDRDLMAVFVGNPPIVESCDQTGTRKDLFNNAETIYVNGTGYGQLAGADIYIVEDTAWTDGMTIPARVPGTATVVNSDLSGNILPTLLWNPPLAVGKYDVCIDVNRNGRYDLGIDALDDSEIQASAGYQVIPEFTSFFILSLFIAATLLVFGVRKGKSRGGELANL